MSTLSLNVVDAYPSCVFPLYVTQVTVTVCSQLVIKGMNSAVLGVHVVDAPTPVMVCEYDPIVIVSVCVNEDDARFVVIV